MNKLILLLLIYPIFGFSQNGTVWITGKIVSDSTVVSGAEIINLNSEKTTASDYNGDFKIQAQQDDMLVIATMNFEYKRRIITAEDIASGKIEIQLVRKLNELEEVVVTYDINPETLGLVPKGQKIYTPAERKLYSATTGPVDMLVNLINGKTKTLEKDVEVEKKNTRREKLEAYFQDDFYMVKLKIPKEHISGFQYFAVENKEIAAAIDAKNKTQTQFFLVKLAPSYLEAIRDQLNKK